MKRFTFTLTCKALVLGWARDLAMNSFPAINFQGRIFITLARSAETYRPRAMTNLV